MRNLLLVLALAIVSLGLGCDKKGEEPAKKEAAAEAPAKKEAAAEAPAKKEAAAEAPAKDEPAKDEAAAAAPAKDEPAAAAPAKLVALDLSKAYEEVPVVVMAPEGATAKEQFGVVEVRAGDGFQLQVSMEDTNGLAALKKEHEANTMNKLKRFLVDTPEAIVYESEVMGRSEFHFAAYVKVGETFAYCEDNKGPTYTQAQVEAMYAACASAKTK